MGSDCEYGCTATWWAVVYESQDNAEKYAAVRIVGPRCSHSVLDGLDGQPAVVGPYPTIKIASMNLAGLIQRYRQEGYTV
jgi:hypothetical protein